MFRESSITRNPTDSFPPGKLPADIFLASVLVEKNSSSTSISTMMHKPQYDSCIKQQNDDDYNSMVSIIIYYSFKQIHS